MGRAWLSTASQPQTSQGGQVVTCPDQTQVRVTPGDTTLLDWPQSPGLMPSAPTCRGLQTRAASRPLACPSTPGPSQGGVAQMPRC